MATVHISPDKLGEAYKYTNSIRNRAKREYANAYIAWLRNGAEGLEPDRADFCTAHAIDSDGRCSRPLSYMAAQAVRMTIDAMRLWEDTQ